MQQYVLQYVLQRHRLKLQLAIARRSSEHADRIQHISNKLWSHCALLPAGSTTDQYGHVPSFSVA